MELRNLILVLIIFTIVMCVGAVTIAINDRKKHNKRFLISQLIIMSAMSFLVTIIVINGKPIGYYNPQNEYKIKEVSIQNNTYEIKLQNGETVYTDNIMYGDEIKYISNCTVKNRTLLGFNVMSENDLLVIEPNVDGFEHMSKSKKQSILKKYNGWSVN